MSGTPEPASDTTAERTSMDEKKEEESTLETSSSIKKGTFGRRAWDDQAYQQRANERLERERSGINTDEKRKDVLFSSRSEALERKPLQARDSKILDLDKQVGKKGIIQVTSEGKQHMPNSKTVDQRKKKSDDEDKPFDPSELAGFYCKLCDRSFRDSASYVDHCNTKSHLARMGMKNRAVKATSSDVRDKLSEKLSQKKASVRPTSSPTTTAKKPTQSEKVENQTSEDEMMRKLGFSTFGSSKK